MHWPLSKTGFSASGSMAYFGMTFLCWYITFHSNSSIWFNIHQQGNAPEPCICQIVCLPFLFRRLVQSYMQSASEHIHGSVALVWKVLPVPFGGSSSGDTGTDLSLLSMSSVAGLFVWALADTHTLCNSVWQIEAMFQISQKKQRRVLIFLLLLAICCLIPLINVKKKIKKKISACSKQEGHSCLWQNT